ncbi:hypothetical protein [Arcobacter sp. F2176]|uniref:hypothetical protein n=1 Tax=Arcobacter sp. F2176 TaxID=2044511 RepID=UPI00100A71BC|nr:hypothetical protein [Arcobacter sp. F2176]RXJ79335.1 hypothetical protein CRU95_14450 [Arcobacter sp. F2176]
MTDSLTKFMNKTYFKQIGSEFDYLRDCIEILIKNYQKDFKTVDDEFNVKINELKASGEYDKPLHEVHSPDVTFGQMMEYNLSEPYINLDLFSGIIIESLIVKHLAYIEKTLVNLSFIIQKKEKEKIPPDYNTGGKFTDMLKAVEYISIITEKNLNIQNLKRWKIIKLLRGLRNILAHGNSSFEEKEGIIDDINKEIDIIKKIHIKSVPEPKTSMIFYHINSDEIKKNEKNIWICSINTDINVLRNLNKICVEFINEVKEICMVRYKIEDENYYMVKKNE